MTLSKPLYDFGWLRTAQEHRGVADQSVIASDALSAFARRFLMTNSALPPSSTPNASGAVALVGRIGIAAIFILSGLSKLAAPAATIGYIASVGLPLPQLGLVAALLIELGGGLALILGFHIRFTAGVLAIFCIVTGLVFHHNLGDQNQFIHFFKNVAMAGGLLNVVALGGQAWSLDARR
jgi:putative oxidoreductase